MLIIGLCGGSGSGKSTVAGILASRNILHIDTDRIYRKLISSPSECTEELANEFGEQIIQSDGSVDRKSLAEIVFSNKDKHAALNRITHRHVLDAVREIIAASEGYLAVCVDAPMLFESGFDRECDILVAVTAPIEDRIKRIIERDNISDIAAKKRIGAQISDDELISRVDFVINNENDVSMLEYKIDELINHIKIKQSEDKKMAEKTKGQEMMEALSYTKKNVYENADKEKIKKISDYAEGYKSYLDNSKTEREATQTSIAMLKKHGYTEYKLGEKITKGDKKYLNQQGKCLIAFRIGEEDIESEGIRILAAHIDSPRIDLKQIPMYEDAGMCFLKTHYYGGVKKYQWTATPLALHGVVVKADGEVVNISLGEKETDPVFYINDLLPHLAQRQSSEPLGSAIAGETLNILVGGLPYDDKDVSEKIKLTVLSILNDAYGITEEDFISAELSLVPAFKAHDIGFDRALIGSYGHDDRVCSYPALTALVDVEKTDKTVMVVLADKEEIGSVGLTGMQSDILVDVINEISRNLKKNGAVVRSKSKCLSADVTAAYDPNFADVYEKRNSAIISCGTTMSKYTGARGKSSTNDASAEYVGYIRRLFAENGVIWQTAELGKVDAGGGGTVAMYIANHNIETVDLGVPVLSMHAPYEVVSKADVYSTYEAFVAFIK